MIRNKYISNVIWLFSEKILTIVGGLLITIYTARYLGPENIGILNYALAVGALVVPIAQLGSQSLIYDRTAKSQRQGAKLIKASQSIRRTIFILLSIILIIFEYFSNDNKEQVVIIIAVLFSYYFTSMDSYKPFFDANLKSKSNVIATQVGLILSQLLRVGLIAISSSLCYFSLPYIVLTMFPYFIKKYIFQNDTSDIKLRERDKSKYKEYSIKAGVPLVVSALSVTIYTKVGQIMLESHTGSYDVGIYSAAITLGQSWVFVPLTLVTVLLSKVIKEKKDRESGFGFIYLFSTVVSLFFLLCVNLYETTIIQYTFGPEFLEVEKILGIITVNSFFVVWGTIGYRVIINSGGYDYLMKKMVIMTVFNVVMSYYCIAHYGLVGAAYSALITEFVSSTVGNYFYKNGYILRINMKSLFSFWYYKKFNY